MNNRRDKASAVGIASANYQSNHGYHYKINQVLTAGMIYLAGAFPRFHAGPNAPLQTVVAICRSFDRPGPLPNCPGLHAEKAGSVLNHPFLLSAHIVLCRR